MLRKSRHHARRDDAEKLSAAVGAVGDTTPTLGAVRSYVLTEGTRISKRKCTQMWRYSRLSKRSLKPCSMLHCVAAAAATHLTAAAARGLPNACERGARALWCPLESVCVCATLQPILTRETKGEGSEQKIGSKLLSRKRTLPTIGN